MIPRSRFVDIAGRRVAWRTCGAGPAAVLLHGSPQSSRALAALGDAVAQAGLCAIMPDTPGAGHSTPLPQDDLTIDDLAEALAGFVDAIGLGRFALYGSHTGAAIACAFAAKYPGRVTGLVFDGIAAWTAAERAAYVQDYAPPFLPRGDGGHLTWLWSRMEAQSLFFPWHRQSAATWRGVDLSPPWHLHRNAMDMLEAGDAYRAIYQASLAFDPADYVPRVGPARMLMLGTDVLQSHVSRPALAPLPVTLFDTPPALHRAVAAALAANPGDAAPVWPAAGAVWRGSLAGTARPLVLLHQAGGSSRVFEPVLSALAASGPVVAFDLPGHGFDETEMPPTAAALGALLDAQCRALGLADYVVAGLRFGGLIAGAMSRPGVRAAALGAPCTAPDLAARGALNLEPCWDGSHLLRAWRVAWRQAIFDPWYQTAAAASRTPPDSLDPAAIHEAALDLLRAGPAWSTANAIEAQAGHNVETILPAQPDQWPASLSGWRQAGCDTAPA
jgi:pimeloyl-ACP methyl ester carboxylesterase